MKSKPDQDPPHVHATVVRSGWVFEGIARIKGERIEVPPELFQGLVDQGFLVTPIRVRALKSGILSDGNRVLLKGEEGIALSAENARNGHRYGDLEVLNADEVGLSLPPRFNPQPAPITVKDEKQEPPLKFVRVQALRDGASAGVRGLREGEVGLISEERLFHVPPGWLRVVSAETPLSYPHDPLPTF